MAHSDDKRRALRLKYIRGRLTIKQAAREVGIPYKTALAWRTQAKAEGDNWDRERFAYLLSTTDEWTAQTASMELFAILHDRLIQELHDQDDIKTLDRITGLASLADTHSKYLKNTKQGNPEVEANVIALDVMKKLQECIFKDYPQHAAAFGEMLDALNETLSKHYG